MQQQPGASENAEFQPTLPARGATPRFLLFRQQGHHFNPRSPHGERRRPIKFGLSALHFNPRSPHGERLKGRVYNMALRVFQPTLPARGATTWKKSGRIIVIFQPTLPARGATMQLADEIGCEQDFNPRSPHGERRGKQKYCPACKDFNPRSPHGERLLARE